MTIRRVMLFSLAVVVLFGCTAHRYTVKENMVTFSLRIPRAVHVAICSSIDGFRPHPAVRTLKGAWEVDLPSHAPFTYFYLVDDAAFVPDCPMSEDDEFGAKNCVFDPHL